MPLLKTRHDLDTALRQNQALRAEVARLEHALCAAELLAAMIAHPVDPTIEPLLSPREAEVLIRLMAGDSNTQVAQALFMAEDTVKSHIASIYPKLHVHNRAGVVMAGIRLGYPQPEEDKPL